MICSKNSPADTRPSLHAGKPLAALFILLLFFFAPFAVAQEKTDWYLDGEPSVVSIAGEIYVKTFPGPPEYESIEKGDLSETNWILKLYTPICAAITSQEEAWIKYIIRDVKKVMLVMMEYEMYEKYRHLIQKPVTVTGTLWEAHTGHHHTPALITVQDIKPK